jgi:hypothetical protein
MVNGMQSEEVSTVFRPLHSSPGYAESLSDLINIERYPIDDPGSAAWQAEVDITRSEIEKNGFRVLRDFIRPSLHERLRSEGEMVAPLAYYEAQDVNAYNLSVKPSLPKDHPARITMSRGNAFVTRDQIPETAIIQRLYADPRFKNFIAAGNGMPAVYELADPLAGLTLNVIEPGKSHPWHFDVCQVAVTIMTQKPETGGEFQYCPDIRSPKNENLDSVRAVLLGKADHLVRTVELRLGDLQLFRGRHALHRVTTVHGERARHTAIFAYGEQPGVVSSVERARQIYGRVTPVHLATEKIAKRADELLD